MPDLVYATAPVSSALLARQLPHPHFADAYAVVLPPGAPTPAAALAYALLGQGPAWLRQLMRLRDALVRPLGLRTFPPRPAAPALPLVPGAQFGPFRVLCVTPAEVVLGQDDRHLDFRVSVRLEPGAARAVVTTTVRCHNTLGRLYFALIRPFHRRVVPALLRRGLSRAAGGS